MKKRCMDLNRTLPPSEIIKILQAMVIDLETHAFHLGDDDLLTIASNMNQQITKLYLWWFNGPSETVEE